jgi:ATP-dependent DNA ligase
MKLSDLQQELIDRKIDLNSVEPLHNGKKITSRDYIRTIQQYEIEQLGGLSALSWGMQQRLSIHEPMLCASYKDMKPHEQEECMTSIDWLAERKLNGVRMLMTYCPHEGFEFFSRNLSVKNFLPVQYTDTILIEWNNKLLTAKEFVGFLPTKFVLDTEACCKKKIIDTTRYRKKGGTTTNSELNAISTTLSIEPEISHKIQREQCAVSLIVFDCLCYDSQDEKFYSLIARKNSVEDVVFFLNDSRIKIEQVDWISKNKEEFYKQIVEEGGEGIVLKNKNAPYCSDGSRAKDGFVKRKRTVAESYGSDIDAYIVGVEPSNKKNKFSHLIGAVNMAVMLQMKDKSETETIIASIGAMPLEMREAMTMIVEGEPCLRPEYMHKVLVIDGQDISPKAKRFRHARADWDRGFREDKSSVDCKLSAEFLDSQIF